MEEELHDLSLHSNDSTPSQDEIKSQHRSNSSNGYEIPLSVELDFNSSVSQTIFCTQGTLVIQSDAHVPYLMLNASLWSGDRLVENTKYMIIDVEPDRNYSFNISENYRRLEPNDFYICILKVEGPDGFVKSEKQRCKVVQDNPVLVTWNESRNADQEDQFSERDSHQAEHDPRQTERDTHQISTKSTTIKCVDQSSQAPRHENFDYQEDSGDLNNFQNENESAVHENLDDFEESRSYLESPQNRSCEDQKGLYVGSINSNKYHYPDCRYAQKIKPENRIWFADSEDARAQGYVPCKVCKPP
ncbi:MAG: Ada metal-binding domain-containing protein [Methanotrichaceae archaeon]